MLLSLGTLLVAQFLGGHAQSLAPGVFDPNCTDHLDNCNEFQWDTCINALFKQWVFNNCRQHCKLCIGPTTLVTTTPIPPCIDVESNCHSYPDDMCSKDLYRVWAKANCRQTCGFCGVIQVVPTPAIGVFDPNCTDHLDNCNEFQWDTCINALFKQWVFDNCRQHCKLCIGPTTTVTTTPTPPCIDEEIYCHLYPDDMCSKDLYRVWANANCRQTCGFCGVIQLVPPPAIG